MKIFLQETFPVLRQCRRVSATGIESIFLCSLMYYLALIDIDCMIRCQWYFDCINTQGQYLENLDFNMNTTVMGNIIRLAVLYEGKGPADIFDVILTELLREVLNGFSKGPGVYK